MSLNSLAIGESFLTPSITPPLERVPSLEYNTAFVANDEPLSTISVRIDFNLLIASCLAFSVTSGSITN